MTQRLKRRQTIIGKLAAAHTHILTAQPALDPSLAILARAATMFM
jgi:hypothetical protein